MNRASERGTTPLAIRFLAYFAITYVLLIGAMGWFILVKTESSFTENLVDRLGTDLMLARQGMPTDSTQFQAWVDSSASLSGYRFTIIDADGLVLADSEQDPSVMENHLDRPEVRQALAGEVGRATRVSASTGYEQQYVAVATDQGLILRLSWSTEDLHETLAPARRAVWLISILVAVFGVVVAWLLARRLAAPISELTSHTLALSRGEEGDRLRRLPIGELDQLGNAIDELDRQNRDRLVESRAATGTLEAVLGALPQATLLIGETDLVVYANPSAQDLLGSVPRSLSGLAPFPLQTAVRDCREQGAPVVALVEHGKPVRRLRGLAAPFAHDDRVLLVVDDVTERERAASVRRDFVANASHELKTPVAAIIASADALQLALERGDPSAEQFSRRIEGSARQLDRLVTDLLDLSRLERDQPELEPMNIDELVREEVERIRPMAEERGIRIVIDLAPVRVAASRRDLSAAVRNLLDNSVRHTPGGGSISTTVEAVGGEAVVRIEDTGEGIPTRELDRIFERFYRVDSARARATGGTGLGLAIVKHVVESHAGDVEVDSELGVGSTFRVSLPLLTDESPDRGLA